MTAEGFTYLSGYSVGAGGIVLCGERALLVRLGYGSARAVAREVLEETGVAAEVEGLLAVRSRVLPNENSTYLVFLLRATTLETHSDGVEALDARFFSRDEVEALPNITPMTRLLVARVFAGAAHPLARMIVGPYPEDEFALFV